MDRCLEEVSGNEELLLNYTEGCYVVEQTFLRSHKGAFEFLKRLQHRKRANRIQLVLNAASERTIEKLLYRLVPLTDEIHIEIISNWVELVSLLDPIDNHSNHRFRSLTIGRHWSWIVLGPSSLELLDECLLAWPTRIWNTSLHLKLSKKFPWSESIQYPRQSCRGCLYVCLISCLWKVSFELVVRVLILLQISSMSIMSLLSSKTMLRSTSFLKPETEVTLHENSFNRVVLEIPGSKLTHHAFGTPWLNS